MSKKIKRNLKVITVELQTMLKGETSSILTIGELLLEAREQIEHGGWMDWLGENFSMSVSSCENYMNAARFARKFPGAGNLKLRASALYLLGSGDAPFDENAIEAILTAAETNWVSERRAWDIAISMRPKPEPEERADWEDAELAPEPDKEMAEVEAILDGPPPALPAPPEATVHDVIVPPFDQAIKTLGVLKTKPLDKFAGTTHTTYAIRGIRDFLDEVADAVDRYEDRKSA